MKNAVRFPPRGGTVDVFCRQNGKFARLGVKEGFFFPGTTALHEHAPAMTAYGEPTACRCHPHCGVDATTRTLKVVELRASL
jgi:hypothetical protein